MSRRGKRTPTEDELALWRTVADTAKPLRPGPEHAAKRAASMPPKTQPTSVAAVPPPKPAAKAPPLATLDRRTRGRIARGAIEIDRRLDLHGMTQESAHRRLVRFLHEAQADGARLVLVITGKGRSRGDASFDREGGVLRRMVPHWLSAGALRTTVVGFEEAAPHHGGGGALYVRIRRARD
jgi:DNA-nicking Smr family endonuclease